MKVALAGDTMLGRKVAEHLLTVGTDALVALEVVEVAHEADLFVLNLECTSVVISARVIEWSNEVVPD